MLPNVDQEYSNWVEHAKVLLLLFADTIKILMDWHVCKIKSTQKVFILIF